MSYQNQGSGLDHAWVAKMGFFAGVALFAVGAVGEIVGHLLLETMPATADQALLAMVGLGIATALFVPIIFGAILPLIE